MADCRPANPEATDSRTSSPLAGKKRAQQSPVPRIKHQIPDPGGHCLRKVTLTKPTFCHSCSDFIWGLVGFLCEVCNFMCHEKCLKTLRSACSCMTPSLVQVPVSHCFGPAGQKKRFCSVCRKQTEGNTALRCEVCELHVHADCSLFSCADCRSSQVDGTLQQDTFHHHWREGNLPAAARCDVCRRSCSSSDVMTGTRCEWCGITTHVACYLSVPAECTLGRLRGMMLPPSCVRLDSRNFSKMHLRATRNEEVVEAVLRSFFLPGDPQDFELKEVVTVQRLHSDDILNRNGDHDNRSPDNGTPDNRTPPREGCPDNAWLLRLRLRDPEVIKVFSSWNSSFVSVSVSKDSSAETVLSEVLRRLDRKEEDVSSFSLMEVYMSSKQVQRQAMSPQEKILEKLQEIRKVSLRQMNQTRLVAVPNRKGGVLSAQQGVQVTWSPSVTSTPVKARWRCRSRVSLRPSGSSCWRETRASTRRT
ncbi:hypothetical protein JOQ06_016563 [Pogonophryne albipinna]|uniref:diacylglycerol kinase (ATP) n=1 Tax=Pogonophryne albipinna TaxID=1090488 RepID=A0AAD6F5K8_9TELE|nr:hypothetical protein JOQ06_016563 [Pogonophryne albipinna]